MHSMFAELFDEEESIWSVVLDWAKVALVLALIFGGVFVGGYATAYLRMGNSTTSHPMANSAPMTANN